MDKSIGIALVLSAKNQASNVMDEFFSKTEARMKALGQGTAKIGEGIAEIYAAKKGVDMLNKTVDAFADVQEAQIAMRTTMMGKGGIFDQATYKKLTDYAETISDNFTGTQASYTQMFQELMRNRIDPKLILGGLGEEVAKLGVVLDTPPAKIAEFTAHMINDAGVNVKKARDVMDMVARFSDMGVGTNGPEAVKAMTDYFGKASLGMKGLGWQGIEATKTVGLMGSMFIAMGLQANTVGTNFRRIEDSLRSIEKTKLVQQGAKSVGINLQFNDAKGNPLGPENMIHQFEKLKGLAPGVIEAILKPFGGKQGLSTDFIEDIAGGKMDFNAFKKQYEAKAAYEEKFNEIMKGYNRQKQVFASNFTNAMARIGMALAPTFAKILTLLNNLVVSVKNFAKEHPKIFKVAAAFVAIASAALAFQGVITMIKGIIMVARVLNLTLAMNPFMLIAMAIAGAAAIVYIYWDDISSFFSKLWKSITEIFKTSIAWLWKYVVPVFSPGVLIYQHWNTIGPWFHGMWEKVVAAFKSAINWLWKYVVPVFSPGVLIYQHWNTIGPWFHGMWEKVKNIFKHAVEFVKGLGSKFFDAGRNIVNSIWAGMKSLAHKPVEMIESIAKKMRAFLPFSPAKEGPLRDIHKVKLVETIAMSLKPTALISAWNKTLGSFSGAVQGSKPIQVNSNGGGGASMVFAPVIHLNGSATAADGKMLADTMRKEFDKWFRDMTSNKQRVAY